MIAISVWIEVFYGGRLIAEFDRGISVSVIRYDCVDDHFNQSDCFILLLVSGTDI